MQALSIDKKRAALIKGIQWCAIWVTKYTTKHNIRHILTIWHCIRKYIPYGNILTAQQMPKNIQNANITPNI